MNNTRKDSEIFSLENFNGPLKFLLQLIHKNEIDIQDVSIKEITSQFRNKLPPVSQNNVDDGAEFVDMASRLIWLKSKRLLPYDHHSPIDEIDEEEGNSNDLVQKILEYYHYKQKGKELAQSDLFHTYCRPQMSSPALSFLDLDHLSLEELGKLYNNLVDAFENREGVIEAREEWSVSDKMETLREKLANTGRIFVEKWFLSMDSKEETIVAFLAILELMKSGELRIGRRNGLAILVKDPLTPSHAI